MLEPSSRRLDLQLFSVLAVHLPNIDAGDAAPMPKLLNFKNLLPSTCRYSSPRLLHHQAHTLSKPNVYADNLRLRALVSAGDTEAARKLFDQMPERDPVSWNTMIAAYWQKSDAGESERLFRSMPRRSVVSWNCMIAGCIENGLVEEALEYFYRMPGRSISSWNAIISGLVKHDRFDEAEKLFAEMPRRNVISYTTMVDGFARKGEIAQARRVFDRIPSKNLVSWAAMISGYVENGMMEEAKRLFEQMPEKNVVAYTAMITGYCKEGHVVCARRLFEEIENKDVISWNAMIAGYAHNGHGEEAINLQREMLILGIKPDHWTLIGVLTACSFLTSLQVGRQTHAVAIKSRLDSHVSLCNALIAMYSKCGNILDSNIVFQNCWSRDIVSWNTMIAAYAQHGHYKKSLVMFDNLVKDGQKPDGITFLSILSACGHAGMVEESLSLFDMMVYKYRVSPGAEHFSCLVDILCRAGKLDKAYHLIMTMQFEADSAVWSSLLGASRAYCDVELGELAARKLVELDPQNSGAYVMLSNIYAAAGMWTEVTRVRLLMREQGVQKQRGHSWVEIGDKAHIFIGGDVCHPEIGKVHSELDKIWLHMQITDDKIVEFMGFWKSGNLTAASVETC